MMIGISTRSSGAESSRSRAEETSLSDFSRARETIQRRLDDPPRASIPTAPATWLLQRGGLGATIEQHFCDEALGVALERRPAPGSVLVVDLAGTRRAAALWTGRATSLLADRSGDVKVTLALPATRKAGRGRLLDRHLTHAAERTGVPVTVLCGPADLARSAPTGEDAAVVRESFDLIIALSLGGAAGLGAPWPNHPGRAWLELADAAVLSFVEPSTLATELEWLLELTAPPFDLAVEALDSAAPRLVSEVALDDIDEAVAALSRLFESAGPGPWRVVAKPAPGFHGTPLSCPDEVHARDLVAPLTVHRSLVADRLRLLSAMRA